MGYLGDNQCEIHWQCYQQFEGGKNCGFRLLMRYLGPLHTRDWEPMTMITLHALPLVEKAEPVQVRFTQHLRDLWSMWMQDGCKVYLDTYMASSGSWSRGQVDNFQNPPRRGRPNTKPGYHGTLNAHNRWFIIFYHVWGPSWIFIEGPVPYDFTLHLRVVDHTTWFLEVSWDCLWMLTFGLSQFHGHSSWLMCEVALMHYHAITKLRIQCYF